MHRHSNIGAGSRKRTAARPAVYPSHFFLHSSSSISTRMISFPICFTHFQGMMYSVSRPRKEQSFPGPGTISATTQPVQESMSASLTQPRERQVQILITSFCRRSQIRIRTSHMGFITAYAKKRKPCIDNSGESGV